MNAEAMEDIMDDTILDEAHDCQMCANTRLIDRQRELIGQQQDSLKVAVTENEWLRDQVAALKEEIAAHVRGVA